MSGVEGRILTTEAELHRTYDALWNILSTHCGFALVAPCSSWSSIECPFSRMSCAWVGFVWVREVMVPVVDAVSLYCIHVIVLGYCLKKERRQCQTSHGFSSTPAETTTFIYSASISAQTFRYQHPEGAASRTCYASMVASISEAFVGESDETDEHGVCSSRMSPCHSEPYIHARVRRRGPI